MTDSKAVLDLNSLARQVLQNCEISDSRHAGLYSICGLALRLRDLYKWENDLNPWVEKDSAEILEWIGVKEQRWEELIDNDYDEISIFEQRYDPFDAAGINAVLEPHGVFYGAGYAQRLKPAFFLAPIENKAMVDGFPVYTLGCELARDLLTIPALSQDCSIILRMGSARLFLWDQLIYINKSARPALNVALEKCGLEDKTPEALRGALDTLLETQRETYIYHELGEIRDDVFNRAVWREIIADHPHTPIELLARAVKDLLADTNAYGTLQNIIKRRETAALAFYVAFFDGLAKTLFPEINMSFHEFVDSGDWAVIEAAVSSGHQTALHYAEELIGIHETGKKHGDGIWVKNEIQNRILKKILPQAK